MNPTNNTCEQIHSDFQPYIDSFGLVQPTIGGSSGNGLLYTAEYLVALSDNDSLLDSDISRLNSVYQSCELQPGLMMRTPQNGYGQEGPDDYVGCGLASWYLQRQQGSQTGLAQRILNYGRSDKWLGLISKYNYNNINPGVFTIPSWIGRQPQVICHLQFAAGENPALWRKIWWCLAILQSMLAPASNQDSFTLAWCLVRVAYKKSILCDIMIYFWLKKELEKVPGGISQNLSEYFNNPSQPLVIWLKNSTAPRAPHPGGGGPQGEKSALA